MWKLRPQTCSAFSSRAELWSTTERVWLVKRVEAVAIQATLRPRGRRSGKARQRRRAAAGGRKGIGETAAAAQRCCCVQEKLVWAADGPQRDQPEFPSAPPFRAQR